jgi:hypothetical protein
MCLSALFIYASTASSQERIPREVRLEKRVNRQLSDLPDLFEGWNHLGKLGVDSLRLNLESRSLHFFLAPDVTHMPVRAPWIDGVRQAIKENLSSKYRDWSVELTTGGRPLEDFVPQYFRRGYLPDDSLRMIVKDKVRPLVKVAGQPAFSKGLGGHHIALWPSHGYYYEASLDRWEWQRARLFGTVEDLFPFSFIHGFLAPMLENAGARVLIPRERDIQSQEVVVDNDGSTVGSDILIEGAGLQIDTLDYGFALSDTLFEGDNPFQSGSFLRLTALEDQAGKLTYLPCFPQSGEYAVYVSWAHGSQATDSVAYVVKHSGGSTLFYVNQTMGYGTWVYLGTFSFVGGANPEKGSVTLLVPNNANVSVTADAVRFGGGMGNVARRPSSEYVPKQWSLNEGAVKLPAARLGNAGASHYKLSGKPRWMEAARYWLQNAGMPDTLVYSLNQNKNDYNDDYQSRGEWVNYLMGAPNGPSRAPDLPGLNIPIDLAFAFHTDAGITPNDSVIGTLGIYSSVRNEGLFPNGTSKMASRDLTDLIQTQIVSDIRASVNSHWTRRAMWDKAYSEAWKPGVPTMLLELLSHQNLADMEYGLDPRFKFKVARAIYKGMVRFQAAREGREAVITPLAPDHMAIEHRNGRRVKISWKPVLDSLEASAVPTQYKVYRRLETNGFDNGVVTFKPFLIVDLPEYETMYSFKVAAVNEGGESLTSEILSVSLQPDSPNLALIVNGFDRVAPPAFVEGTVAGLAPWDDEGVPYIQDVSFTGKQYDYNRSSPWLDDDSPGHGASYCDSEGRVIPGNNFDFVRVHGEAMREAGLSFVSVSDEVFEEAGFDISAFMAVDVIFGEEKATVSLSPDRTKEFRIWTPSMISSLGRYLENGGNLLLSGAYIGSEMIENSDSAAIRFAKNYLHFEWRTNHADNLGEVVVTDEMAARFPASVNYNTGYLPGVYKVEAPDGLEPKGESAHRLFRYAGNNVSAGVAYEGKHRSVVLGFPFESIVDVAQRNALMNQIVAFFESNLKSDNGIDKE